MHRSTAVPVLAAALALLLFPAATAAQTQAQLTEAEATLSGACTLAYERCAVNCAGLADRAAAVSCLIGCDNAATASARDEKVTLNSEEWMAQWGGPVLGFKAACNPTTPCGSEYGSCGSWSSYYDCGDPYCGIYRFCGECSETWCFGDATRQHQERYRVCFNQQGQPCTEYQRISIVLGCGC